MLWVICVLQVIAPDYCIEKFFAEPLGIKNCGEFQSIGREIRTRFGYGGASVTQQDGLFVSISNVIGVELKIGAKSSPEQMLKYVSLFTDEERITGPKENLGLIYICPDPKKLSDLNEFIADRDKLIEIFRVGKLPKYIQEQFRVSSDHLISNARRVQITFKSWKEHYGDVARFHDRTQEKTAGDQTLRRLLAGYLAQLGEHKGLLL